MTTAVRRGPAPRTAAVAHINFGEDSFYSGGFQLPDGNWCMFATFQLYAHEKSKFGKRLGVMFDCYNLDSPQDEPRQQFLSLGDKAHESFQPDPDAEGKKFMAVPEAKSTTVGRSTNWDFFRRSLLDCGMPRGYLIDDLTVLDGMWVHTTQMDEPEERKAFKNRSKKTTGEGESEEAKQEFDNKIIVVTNFIDGGRVYAGEAGGWPPPAAAPKGPAKPGAAPARPGAPARPAPARPAAPAPAAEVTEGEGDDLSSIVTTGIEGVLAEGSNANGMKKLALQVAVLKSVMENYGEEVSKEAAAKFFNVAAGLNSLLAPMGYHLVGPDVKPIQ